VLLPGHAVEECGKGFHGAQPDLRGKTMSGKTDMETQRPVGWWTPKNSP
jgi:hypothetical protein